MNTTESYPQIPSSLRLRLPLLTELSLSGEQLAALQCQGCVSEEYRGRRGPFYKLRFRFEGRQVVKYLGQDASRARRIARELQKVRAAKNGDRELVRDTRTAMDALRRFRRELTPLLAANGYHFHGLDVRRKRTNRQPSRSE